MTTQQHILPIVLLFAANTAWSQEPPETPEHVVGDAPYPFATVDPRDEVKEPIELPESVADKLALLTEEEIAFLESSDARDMAGDLDGTLEALEERTPEEVKAWVNALQQVMAQMRYDAGVDEPNIAFNTASPEFNAWRAKRPRSMDPAREAGAVPLSRGSGYRSNGPPTFGGYPLALTMEDLVAAEVDVAIIGAP